jgi:hypothetical protein
VTGLKFVPHKINNLDTIYIVLPIASLCLSVNVHIHGTLSDNYVLKSTFTQIKRKAYFPVTEINHSSSMFEGLSTF